MRKYRAAHPEKHRQAVREWRERNPEKVAAMEKERRDSGRGYEAEKRWREKHPEAWLAVGHRYRARLRDVTFEDTKEVRLLLSNDPCADCGGPAGEVDHIDALMIGGTETNDNLTAACKSCNSSKGTTPMLLWMAGAGRATS
jgi:5-methylcytosine-specific restriction endonuclease McrA